MAARIINLSRSEVLRTTRQLVLEKDNFQVFSVATVTPDDTFSKNDKFDLAVIGHEFPGAEKRRMANLINHRFPGLSILELCLHSPEIPGADFILSDSPAELVAAVKEIISGRRVRGFLP